MRRFACRFAFVGALVYALAPAPAEACGEPEDQCDWTPQPVPDGVAPTATAIPADGELELVVDGGNDSDAWSLAVEVYDALGVAVPGTFIARDTFGRTTWRPSAPLRPDERYLVVARVVTEPSGPYPECDGMAFETVIDALAPAGPSEPPEVTFSTSWEVAQEGAGLGTLACCDGASPRWEYESDPSYGCNGSGEELRWPDDGCFVVDGHGRLVVEYRMVAVDGTDPSERWLMRVVTEGNVAHDDDRGGDVSTSQGAPGCARVELRDRVLGTIHAETYCHGDDDDTERFGEMAVDISESLAEHCEGAPYVCEVVDNEWDPWRCRTWPVREDAPYIDSPLAPEVEPGPVPPFADGGCAVAGRDGGWWAVGWIAAVVLVRGRSGSRRSTRASRHSARARVAARES